MKITVCDMCVDTHVCPNICTIIPHSLIECEKNKNKKKKSRDISRNAFFYYACRDDSVIQVVVVFCPSSDKLRLDCG